MAEAFAGGGGCRLHLQLSQQQARAAAICIDPRPTGLIVCNTWLQHTLTPTPVKAVRVTVPLSSLEIIESICNLAVDLFRFQSSINFTL